jgi:copper(I)-binding protein
VKANAMNTSSALKKIAICAILAPASGLFSSAFGHVSLQQPTAEPGSAYKAVLRVGHGCDGSATTAIAVQLPAGFSEARPEARDGWTLSSQGDQVRWTAAGKEAALPSKERAEFVVNGKLPQATGPLWFKVLQVCEQGRIDWSQVPATGSSIEGLKTPAVLLQVQAPAAVQVEGGWVRPSVPGQAGTGGFMKLTARQPVQLVGATSPVAGVAEVHDMKMEGEVMKMRPLRTLELPAGKTVELKPGGMHLMLMDLKQPLVKGSTVPVTLLLRDARGVESRLDISLAVSTAAPGGPAPDAAMSGHKH